MESPSLFVDFMYAVAVGAMLPRLDEKALSSQSPLGWGLLFLAAVFLEDFYLYHTKVVPQLEGLPPARGFILAMLIIGAWYLSQAAFPNKPRLFLVSFSLFFLLKLFGGVLLKPTQYPTRLDFIFLLPAITALLILIVQRRSSFLLPPSRLLWILAPVWVITVAFWWLIDTAVL